MKEEDNGIFFLSRKKEENKMQRREGIYLSSLASTFGMKHSSWRSLSTFLQH
jgi:hypothetical protein